MARRRRRRRFCLDYAQGAWADLKTEEEKVERLRKVMREVMRDLQDLRSRVGNLESHQHISDKLVVSIEDAHSGRYDEEDFEFYGV